MKLCRTQCVVVLALALLSAAAFGQSFRGTILGTVRDTTGAILPGATITVTNVGTNVSRTAVTNETGDFVIPELLVGRYSLTAGLAGFKKEVLTSLDLNVDQRLRADVRMEVGNIAETVEVTAETPLIATDSATVGTVIDNRKIVDFHSTADSFFNSTCWCLAQFPAPSGLSFPRRAAPFP